MNRELDVYEGRARRLCHCGLGKSAPHPARADDTHLRRGGGQARPAHGLFRRGLEESVVTVNNCIVECSFCFKHPKFHEESEWRLWCRSPHRSGYE